MKLMTLNTHSLQEENGEAKLEWFVEGVLAERPDIIALQEVNQTQTAPQAEAWQKAGQFPFPAEAPLRRDNFVARVAEKLRQRGVDCHWAWLPVKQGYGKYDEGVALLSLGRKIIEARAIPLSRTEHYQDWRRRMVLGIRTEGRADWFYSVHLGWWDDAEEPFREQWARLKNDLPQGRVWLMGDFNAPDVFSDQSYAHIRRDGWADTHRLAAEKGRDFTVSGIIDGWKGKLPDETIGGMRLDYIFCSEEVPVRSSKVLFDGENRPVVSDHFAVLIETGEVEA